MRAYLADSEEVARKALTRATGDKGIDAILIDERAKQANIIQGKFHFSLGEFGEKRNDILSFVDLCTLPWEKRDVLKSFYSQLDPLVRQKFEELVHYVRRNDYEMRLYYVTTGRCSNTICQEAEERGRQAEGPVEIFILDHNQVVTIFKDYLEGVSPAVPTLLLKIASEASIQTEGGQRPFFNRWDKLKWIDSIEA